MKIFTLIISYSLIFAALVLGEDLRQDFPESWSTALKAGTEKMVIAKIAPLDAIAMTRAMSQAQFNDKQILAAQKTVIEAHEKGVPVEPVMNKAYEGIAKRVPPPLVVAAMERVAVRYDFAFTLARQIAFQETERRHLGQIMVMGIAAGLAHRDADSIVKRLQTSVAQMKQPDRRTLVSQTLLTARDMARQGVSSGTTAEVVNQALQKGFNGQEMKALHHAFMSHSPRTSVEHLAKNISKAIQQGKSPQNTTINMGKSGQRGHSGGNSGTGPDGGHGGDGSGSGPGPGGDSGSGGSGSGPGSGGDSGSGGAGSGPGSGGGSGSGGSGNGPGSGEGSGSGGAGNGSGSSGGSTGGGNGSGGGSPGGGT